MNTYTKHSHIHIGGPFDGQIIIRDEAAFERGFIQVPSMSEEELSQVIRDDDRTKPEYRIVQYNLRQFFCGKDRAISVWSANSDSSGWEDMEAILTFYTERGRRGTDRRY